MTNKDFYSQDGQDKFISKLLRDKKNGFFLDVGAHDGIQFSNSFYFEKNLNWSGICIEPNPEVYKQLIKNRSCISLNCCISNQSGILKFLSITGYGEMLSGLVDFFDKKHINRIETTIREKGGTKTYIDVEVIPLKKVLADNKVTKVDYCNIDIEGGEIAVLNSIDFSKVSIEIFSIENNYNTKVVYNFLRPLGYKLIGRVGADEIYQLHSNRYDLILSMKINRVKSFIDLSLQRLGIKINIF